MNSHLTHQQLLSYLDGELSKGETRGAKAHLQSCWTCRTEKARLEGDITTILDAQNEIVSPALPPPPRSWMAFDALLARRLPAHSPSLWERFTTRIDPLLRPAQILAASICVIALVISAYSIFRAHPVSAKEVLRQIHLADANRTVLARDRVLRERVHIRRKTLRQSTPQTEELDVWKSHAATYWNARHGNSAGVDLENEYRIHDVPMDLPLSAASVEDWGKAAGGSPTISQQGEDLNLSFAGPGDGAENSIDRVSWLIQPRTWQVKQMTLEFPNVSFEVTGDSFSLLPISAVPSDLAAHLGLQGPPPMLVRRAIKPLSASVINAVRLQKLDLNAVELDVFATLHHLNADLGEPVTVTRSSRKVQVGIWQLPDERRQELSAALEDKPGIQVQTAAPPSLTAARNARPETSFSPPLRIVADSTGGDQRLAKFFGSSDKEEVFTRQILATSTTILSHLYALRNLQDQFPPQQENALTPDDRAQLTALVKDHAAAAAAELDALRTQLEPLNATFNIPSGELSANPTPANWQSSSLDALETAKGMDHWLRSLFATSETPVSADTALPRIQQDLSHLSAELGNLGTAAH